MPLAGPLAFHTVQVQQLLLINSVLPKSNCYVISFQFVLFNANRVGDTTLLIDADLNKQISLFLLDKKWFKVCKAASF